MLFFFLYPYFSVLPLIWQFLFSFFTPVALMPQLFVLLLVSCFKDRFKLHISHIIMPHISFQQDLGCA